MKGARITQIEKLVRSLQSDGYTVKPLINSNQKRLVITIRLGKDEGDEIMSQWNDLRKVNGS